MSPRPGRAISEREPPCGVEMLPGCDPLTPVSASNFEAGESLVGGVETSGVDGRKCAIRWSASRSMPIRQTVQQQRAVDRVTVGLGCRRPRGRRVVDTAAICGSGGQMVKLPVGRQSRRSTLGTNASPAASPSSHSLGKLIPPRFATCRAQRFAVPLVYQAVVDLITDQPDIDASRTTRWPPVLRAG